MPGSSEEKSFALWNFKETDVIGNALKKQETKRKAVKLKLLHHLWLKMVEDYILRVKIGNLNELAENVVEETFL